MNLKCSCGVASVNGPLHVYHCDLVTGRTKDLFLNIKNALKTSNVVIVALPQYKDPCIFLDKLRSYLGDEWLASMYSTSSGQLRMKNEAELYVVNTFGVASIAGVKADTVFIEESVDMHNLLKDIKPYLGGLIETYNGDSHQLTT